MAMSARRDRAPTSRSNISSVQNSQFLPSDSTTKMNLNKDRTINKRTHTPPEYMSNTGRSEGELSTGEVLRRLKDKAVAPKNARDQAEIEALGDYNAFSRPRQSRVLPLRSVLLDPQVNNFPPSRTRTELMKKIRVSGAPHPSYDLDADGYVSQQDYKLAKRFDFDGNGVLDPGERQIGKRVLADEFFRSHAHDLDVFGSNFSQQNHKQNVEALTNAYSFERAYERLKSIERTLKAESSKPIVECMLAADQSLTRHNYYTNKFDTTAWNDHDGIPRSSSTFGLTDHGGSRHRLLFSRQQEHREECQRRIDQAISKQPHVNTKRLNLITNIAVENS